MSIVFLAIDTLVKSLDIQDCGTHIKFVLSHQSGPLPIQVGDEVIGFVSQGVNQFRSIFNVVSVDAGSSTVVLDKIVERAEGVPLRLSDSSAKSFLSSLKSGKDLFVPDQALAQSIRDLLLNGGISGSSTRNDVVDRLSIALKRFAQERGGADWKDDYANVNADVRSFFELLDADAVSKMDAVAFKDFCINHTWSLTNGGGAWSIVSKYSDAERKNCCDFFARLLSDPNPSTLFDGAHPKGVRSSCISELLMKFSPDRFGFYNETSHESLVWLGLLKGEFDRTFDWFQYGLAQGALSTIVQKMREMGIPATLDDDAPADFLATNEFLWFVNKHREDISAEIEARTMKPADYANSNHPPQVKKPTITLTNAEDVVLLRLAAALCAKPFAILAGHSGTGKSRMVRQLAYMTAAAHNHKALFEEEDGTPLKSPGNFCMVQVKPNWHDSTDLLGYYSELKGGFKGTDFVKFVCKAYAYPDVPFFVCLDEMNLAPVEQYFAEYLSAIESRKIDKMVVLDKDGKEQTIDGVVTDRLLPDEVWRTSDGAQDYSGLGCKFTQSEHWLKKYGLTIPRNLFIVGTVNMDESTNQFSRKVLDRAFTLEMTDADFEHFGAKDPEPTFADFAGEEFAAALLSGPVTAKKPDGSAPQAAREAFDAQIKNLTALKLILDGTSFVVAYRFANEYMLYAKALDEMRKVVDVKDGSADAPVPDAEKGAEDEEATGKKPDAFDDMVLMKLLPRITGDTEMVMRLFVGDPKEDGETKTLDDSDVKGLVNLLGKKSASFTKMKEIVKRGESNGSGTLTFWP